MPWRAFSALAAAAMLLGLAACEDPVRDNRIDALGPEEPGIPEGPLHRAGQPCLACHNGEGPGENVFSVAGTVYQTNEELNPLPGAVLHFTDSTLRTFDVAA